MTGHTGPCKFKDRVSGRLRCGFRHSRIAGNVFLGAAILAGACLPFCARAQGTRPSSQSSSSGSAASEASHRTVTVDSREQLFAVICALDAAGFEAGASSASDTPGRIQLRQRMQACRDRRWTRCANITPSTLSATRRPRSPVSFPLRWSRVRLRILNLNCAATICRRKRLTLEGFNAILANFYREAKIEEFWQHYQPDYERGVESLRAPFRILCSRSPTIFVKFCAPNSAAFVFRLRRTAGRRENDFQNIRRSIRAGGPAQRRSADGRYSSRLPAFPARSRSQSVTACRRRALRRCWKLPRARRSCPPICATIFRRFLTNVWCAPWSCGCAIFLRSNCLLRSTRPKAAATSWFDPFMRGFPDLKNPNRRWVTTCRI